ncbi:MAG: DUF1338 domain-containing protein [Pseudomonadales bacterium]|nr:DUF1338 domain-containing protein [Pseudomonadales bacterium]
MNIDDYFQELWRGYTEVTPQAQQIHEIIHAHNGHVINDHVAFRTFNRSPIDINSLESSFLEMGYSQFDEYIFPNKKLRARAYVHSDELQPKVFLSELQLESCTQGMQSIVDGLLENTEFPNKIDAELFLQGRLWPTIDWDCYQSLLTESEYAAWLSVMGFRANHFTVFVNKLSKNRSLDEVIELVQSLGLQMNQSGGLIKGNALVGLQQASTLADTIEMEFAQGDIHAVKSCYYEFALRYPDEQGNLYQGFVADSADKIFESTHQKLANM